MDTYESNPCMPPTKIYECETSFDRKAVINRIYLLNDLRILHAYINEAYYT